MTAPWGSATAAQTGGGADTATDLTAWQFWWNLNREPYLRLKSRLGAGVTTGTDEFFLGQGQQEPAADRMLPSRSQIRGRVVPALLRALAEQRSNDIQSGCMIALARIGDGLREDGSASAGIGERLAVHLDDASQELAETAALSLGILGDERWAALLVAILANDVGSARDLGVEFSSSIPTRTRVFAAYGLGQLGMRSEIDVRPALVAALLATLEQERDAAQPDVAMACVAALGLIPLEAFVTEADLAARSGLEAQVDALLAWFGDEGYSVLVRAHVPAAVARLLAQSPADAALRTRVLEVFSASLEAHSKVSNALQQSCALALGQLADCGASAVVVRARALLMQQVESAADTQVRYFSMIALAQLGARPGSSGDWSGLAGRDGVRAFLLERMGSGKAATRSWAGLCVAVLERGLDERQGPGSPDARRALADALRAARAPDQVGALAIACGLVRDPVVREVLLERLAQAGDPEARGHLCVALGLLGERAAIPAISEIVQRSKYQPDLLKSAAIGLGLLGDRDVAGQLVVMLEKASGLASQASISTALGFIGDTRSIEPLIALLEDGQKTGRARGFAAVALGIVGDKDALPWGSRYSVDVNYGASTPSLLAPAGALGLLNLL